MFDIRRRSLYNPLSSNRHHWRNDDCLEGKIENYQVCFSFSVWLCCVLQSIRVRFSFFSTTPRDWLGKTSTKWPVLCRVERKTLTQSGLCTHFVTLWHCATECAQATDTGGSVWQTFDPLYPVYTMQPVVQPVVQPVWQAVVSCKRGFTMQSLNRGSMLK